LADGGLVQAAGGVKELMAEAAEYLMSTGRRLPIVLEGGRGARVVDSAGKDYVDFVAGVGVNCLGHGHPAIVNAVSEQSQRLIHTSNLYYSEPQIALARRLVELSFPARAFFCNSGAEANECAIKLARKWGRRHRGGAYEILTVERSFHGRTLATVTATGQARYSEAFQPLPSGFRHVSFGDIGALRRATGDRTVAVMLEVIVGEGGMLLHPPGYLEAVRGWCDEKNLLLILDEVHTGFGRTGHWFAYQAHQITPDVMTVAKALGGGLPIGACLASSRADVFEPGDHGSTFGGNPLACAVALEVLRVVEEEGLVAHAREMGDLLAAELWEVPHVKEVRGTGLMQGCVFDRQIARELQLACLEHGVIVNAISDDTLRLVPPLVIGADEIVAGVAGIRGAVARIAG
jgi:acetylornithine/N-succinyldiaminopimelate aminotransferase